jgi:RNA polymerase sigma-70 factor (ECF subfamily)
VWGLAQEGQEEAYTRLRRTHWALVEREIRKRLNYVTSEDLQDLEEEVWIAVWMSLPGFDGRSAFATWVVGIAKNIVFSWLRQKRKQEALLNQLLNETSVTSNAATPKDVVDRLAVLEAFDDLAPKEHEVLQLRYFESLTDRGIALRLGLPLGTVKGRIRSGLLHLKGALELTGEKRQQPRRRGRRAAG